MKTSLQRNVLTALLIGLVAVGLGAAVPSATAGTRHPITTDNLARHHDAGLLGYAGVHGRPFEGDDTQSAIEACQRTSLHEAAGDAAVVTVELYDAEQQYAGESATQLDSPATARALERKLARQMRHCGLGFEVTHEGSIATPEGQGHWFRVRDLGAGARYDVVAVVRHVKRVAIVGLTPQHRLGDQHVEAFLGRVIERLG